MRKILPALTWLVLIYVVTVLAEGFDPPPAGFWARVLFELQHVAAHSFVYGVQVVLIWVGLRQSLHEPQETPVVWRIVALIVILGLGQEVLQSLLRQQVTIFGSGFDLFVDGTAAALILQAWRTLRARDSFSPYLITGGRSLERFLRYDSDLTGCDALHIRDPRRARVHNRS